jgi:hypothetical protein
MKHVPMKRISILALFFLLTFSEKLIACDCDSIAPFLTVAPRTDMVALVKVKSFLSYQDMFGAIIPMSMEVEIIEVYKGKETRKTIIVWGSNGSQCRPYLSRFKLDQYYVIAFNKGDARFGQAGETAEDYNISVCGDFWLSVNFELELAWGAVADNQTEIDLKDLKTKLVRK